MSAARNLQLRKALNAFHRQAAIRAYSIETTKTSHTPEEQTLFLRAQDQVALRETRDHLEQLTTHVKKFAAHVADLPTSVPVLSGVKTLGAKDNGNGKHRLETVYETSTIPYTTGLQRQYINEAATLAANVLARAEHVDEHLADLQYEPYPSNGNDKASDLAKWAGGMSKRSRQEQEDALKTMQLDEEAEAARLKGASAGLVQSVRRIEEMVKKDTGPGTEADTSAPKRTSNPFSKGIGPGQRSLRRTWGKASGEKLMEVENSTSSESATTPKPAGAPPKPATSLLGLQARLNSSMAGE